MKRVVSARATRLLVAFAVVASACTAAEAQMQAPGWSGAISLASDTVERGVSQSSGSTALAADLGWSHPLGTYLGLAVSTVDGDQFGGAELQWSPRIGWQGDFAGESAGHWGIGLTGHWFPGALGQRSAALPPRVANAVAAQPQETDFTTAELNLMLGWKGLALRFDRALTDYYGIGEESSTTGPLGQRITTKVADSVGSWHVGLSYRWDIDERLSAWFGIGRQVVKNFEALNYTDWSLGASLRGLGLTWALEATGTNASADYWQVRRRSGGTRELASQRLAASVAWAF